MRGWHGLQHCRSRLRQLRQRDWSAPRTIRGTLPPRSTRGSPAPGGSRNADRRLDDASDLEHRGLLQHDGGQRHGLADARGRARAVSFPLSERRQCADSEHEPARVGSSSSGGRQDLPDSRRRPLACQEPVPRVGQPRRAFDLPDRERWRFPPERGGDPNRRIRFACRQRPSGHLRAGPLPRAGSVDGSR